MQPAVFLGFFDKVTQYDWSEMPSDYLLFDTAPRSSAGQEGSLHAGKREKTHLSTGKSEKQSICLY